MRDRLRRKAVAAAIGTRGGIALLGFALLLASCTPDGVPAPTEPAAQAMATATVAAPTTSAGPAKPAEASPARPPAPAIGQTPVQVPAQQTPPQALATQVPVAATATLGPAAASATAQARAITAPYLLAFHACNRTAANCFDPRNHQTYLAQSQDGARWSLVPGWTPYAGSVPDVIRRGNTLYIYTPNQVRRYRFETGVWESPRRATLTDPEATGGFVDASMILDEQGRLVLFYLPGVIGRDPAGCAPGEQSCVKRFRSATEVPGSDGTAFAVDSGDRLGVTVPFGQTASDPDVFFDGGRYVLYISRGMSEQVYTSTSLRGSYSLHAKLPSGMLTPGIGSIGSGHFDTATRKYWTFVHGGPLAAVKRAVHGSLDAPLTPAELVDVITGSSVGLGANAGVESPGFALNK